MTPTELLRPRYIVIADYPGSFLRVGDILIDQQKDYEFWECNRDLSKFDQSPAQYPAIFHPLNWWEHREEKDMPEYVRYRRGIYKLIEIHPNLMAAFILIDGKRKTVHIDNIKPVGE